jgi:hypothetical protein
MAGREQPMNTVTFTSDTLEEVKREAEQWRLANKTKLIKKEHDPVCVRRPAGRSAPSEEGKVMSASITIVYEDSNGAR